MAAVMETLTPRVHKIFGPPGSGKTTYLLNVVDKELERGVSPARIGYFSFTRKAANEARDRAVAKFPNLNPELDFPWFRTLHSLAYRCLGVGVKDMMSPEHFKQFAKESGIEVAVANGEEEFVVKTDHPILNEINIARIRGEDLRTYYNRSNLEIEWYHFEYVERCYRHFKRQHNLLDFTDLLERILHEPERLPRLETLIIDEAQDLSRLQWDLVQALIERSQYTFVAGDDDQAVFNWAGADVHSFLSLPGDVQILEQSYRVPAKIHELANKVVRRIRKRQPKTWNPREEQGSIQYYNDFEDVDVAKGEWLILAATNYLLNETYDWLKSQGLLFERNGQKSIPPAVLTAVLGWETLRKGKEVPFTVVKQIYKYLGPDCIKRGHKTLPKADPEILYDLSRLKDHHGLQTDAIWHKALTKIAEDQRDYIVALLRRKTSLKSEAQIKLSTIHGAKGGEADNVLLLSGLSSKFVREYDRNPDDIHRLLYVGITRARQSLHIVMPKDIRKGFML
jgi:DNA helicase-2/ATP-dependent DNA helicase PcrA